MFRSTPKNYEGWKDYSERNFDYSAQYRMAEQTDMLGQDDNPVYPEMDDIKLINSPNEYKAHMYVPSGYLGITRKKIETTNTKRSDFDDNDLAMIVFPSIEVQDENYTQNQYISEDIFKDKIDTWLPSSIMDTDLGYNSDMEEQSVISDVNQKFDSSISADDIFNRLPYAESSVNIPEIPQLFNRVKYLKDNKLPVVSLPVQIGTFKGVSPVVIDSNIDIIEDFKINAFYSTALQDQSLATFKIANQRYFSILSNEDAKMIIKSLKN
jgi:hypothetical protein